MTRGRFLAAAATVAALVCPAGASPASTEASLETAARLRDEALAGSGAFDIVRSLSLEVGPRLAGSAGDRAAVAWAHETLESLGFDRVWSQPVTVPHWDRGTAEGWILDPYPRSVVLAALGGSVGTPAAGITAEVVAFDSLEALAVASREEVEGRIVYIGDRMERRRDGAGYRQAVAKRGRGAVAAGKLGAAAVLIRSAGTSTARVAHTGAMRYEEGVARIPAAALSNADADVLSHLLAAGEPVRFQLRSTARTLADEESANVFAEIAGRERADEIVLLACHLDSWDLGQGAVDDGAGCAIVIEALRRLAALPQPPRRTVRIGLFANEEFGLTGAREYAEQLGADATSHVLGMEADLGAGRVWRFDWRLEESAFDWVDRVAPLLEPLGIERGGNEAFGGADLSPLRRAGLPVISLRHDARPYFDVHHTANDTLEQIEIEALDQGVAAYLVAAYLAAEYEGEFRWLPPTEPR